MRSLPRTLALTAVVALALAEPLGACGDKFVRIGRGRYLRGYVAVHPASIVIYTPPSSTLEPFVKKVKLTSALKRAGHTFDTVSEPSKLRQALSAGSVDIVLAAFPDAATLVTQAQASPARPVVVPVVQSDTGEVAAAQHQFHCLIKAPNTANYVLAVIDHEMELRTTPRKRN